MRPRFQADADLNHIIVLATIRQEPAVDFQSAVAAGLTGIDDPAVLAIAATDGRILVTHDRKTMPRHFAEFTRRTANLGLIVIPQSLTVATAAKDILVIWSATEAEEWVNRIAFLPL